MINTKLISIDTSIFGNISKDYFSQNIKASNRAKEVISHLISNGFIPFISIHHIIEIMQHNDDRIVFNRWSLFEKFPVIAWINSYRDNRTIGSIVDLHQLEARLILDNPDSKTADFVSEVRKNHIKYMSGSDFITTFEDTFCALRSFNITGTENSKSVESLTHITDKKINKVKLSTLFESTLKDPAHLAQGLNSLHKKTTEDLLSKGDKGLKNPSGVAYSFINEVLEMGKSLYESKDSLYTSFIKASGARPDQVTPDTTIGELGEISAYNKQIHQILDLLDEPIERDVELSLNNQATWIIWNHLDYLMKNEKRAHGSNMQDKHMGVFSLFVDIFTVDKRVHEYFRQLSKKKPELTKHTGKILKFSKYTDLLDLH